MARRKKGAVRPGRGSRCLICGLDCGKGGPLRRHVEAQHYVSYANGYKRCFNGGDVVINQHSVDGSGEFLVHTRIVRVPSK
jgi:hypothetical protein